MSEEIWVTGRPQDGLPGLAQQEDAWICVALEWVLWR